MVAFSDQKMQLWGIAPSAEYRTFLNTFAEGEVAFHEEDISPGGTQLIVAARCASAIHRWDLRAIRARLKTMNLDWDWPEYAAPAPVVASFSKSQRPLIVQLPGAEPAAASQATVTDASQANP